MSTVYDDRLRRSTLVVPCRYCGKQIYWSISERSHKRTPYELAANGAPTRNLHWATCPKRARRDSAKAARKELA